MKVAHHNDYDTHAVIGGSQIEEFAIAQTAEFFTVLSDTLYSNKPMAVIREVLCNAWDSHIASGCEDQPVVVTITADRLSIRDYGAGIPHEDIHKIYCVYGASTKENDGNQTGGFGLGSKAPFAYSDHFTVVNHHKGLKTVHAISRGSALTSGKPDRRVMVSVPTDQTGVEVIIPVKSRSDKRNFIEFTEAITAFGEMNVTLNGNIVQPIPISEAENNVFLTFSDIYGGTNRINIRYGNVVYPIYNNAEYVEEFRQLTAKLDKIPISRKYGLKDLRIILQAPPNSISVTPSRESISVTETTTNTLKGLFREASKHLETSSKEFLDLLYIEQEKMINKYLCSVYPERVMIVDNLFKDELVKNTKEELTHTLHLLNKEDVAKYYLYHCDNIPNYIKNKLMEHRLRKLIDAGWRRSHDIRKVIKFLNLKYKGKSSLRGLMRTQRFEENVKKQIIRPLLSRLASHDVLKPNALNIVIRKQYTEKFYWHTANEVPFDKEKVIPLLQGVVVITHSKKAYEEDWYLLDKERENFPNSVPRLVYNCPRTKGHKEAAIQFFQKYGYKVIDFATIYDDHRKTQKLYEVSIPKPKKPNGLPRLINSVQPVGSRLDLVVNHHLRDDAPRSTDYRYVIKPDTVSGPYRKFFPWGDRKGEVIARLFGSKIGICVSEPQLRNQIEKRGKGCALNYITDQVVDKVLTSPDIRTYVEMDLAFQNQFGDFKSLIGIIQNSDVLKKHFLLPEIKNKDDIKYYHIFQNMLRCKNPYKMDSWQRKLYDTDITVRSWESHPAYLKLAEQVNESRGIRFLNLGSMASGYACLSKILSEDQKKRVFIETTILNALDY